jgi:sugar lactone lactonase YvrE
MLARRLQRGKATTALRACEGAFFVELISKASHLRLCLCMIVAALPGCGAGIQRSPFMPSGAPQEGIAQGRRVHGRLQSVAAGGYVYVANLTKRGDSQLIVYLANTVNPSPVKTITQGLSGVEGVAVDPSGDVYVANGNAGSVMEYAPGGTSLIETYSLGLTHPTGIIVSEGILYVADSGNAQNGHAQQVFEYALGNGTPLIAIAGNGIPPQMNEGIAVDPVGSTSHFFLSATSMAQMPPASSCAVAGGYTVAENVFPTLWQNLTLSHNVQASGLAFDISGNLYVADICSNDVAIYSYDQYAWTYSGKVPGTFSAPVFISINNGYLAIPSANGTAGGSTGYVTVIDQKGSSSTVIITNGLEHPIGAAVSVNS